MKFYGNIVLMTVICIVVFWMFMALRPAQAFGGAGQVGRYADIASGFAIILPLNIKRVSNESRVLALSQQCGRTPATDGGACDRITARATKGKD